MASVKVTEMTVDELKDLIRDAVAQTISELLLKDPDEGLELSEETKLALVDSLAYVANGGETLAAAQVAADLELEW